MIVVNCRFLTQPVTGVQRFAEQILTELVPLRDDLVLVAPPGELRRAEIGGALVQQIGTRGGHVWEQLELPRYLRAHGRPLLLSLTNSAPMLYRPQIATVHDISFERFPETYSRGYRWFYGTMTPRVLRRARTVITVSEFSRAEIGTRHPSAAGRLRVVPNAVDSRFSQAVHAEQRPPYFLVVASRSPHKNLPRLVDAFRTHVVSTGSGTRLLLIGGAGAAFAGGEELHADESVVALGRVDDDRLIELYAGARGFLFPSLYEGFGIPPLEAQATGTPVASSDRPAMREVLGDSALWFDPESIASIADAIGALDADASLRADLSARGSTNVARFSWSESARLVDDLLDEALGDAAARS